jgi:hypothetical protein
MPSVNPFVGIAPPLFLYWRDQIRSFESLAIIEKASMNVTGSGLPETLGASWREIPFARANQGSSSGHGRSEQTGSRMLCERIPNSQR